MRCAACGARNVEGADWCTQCFAPLRETPAAADPPTAAPASAAAASPPDDAEPPVGILPSTGPPRDGRFRSVAGAIDWRCATCDSWNPLEITRCAVCGASFSTALQGPEDAAPPSAVSEQTAVLASVALPGLGHVLAGRRLTGWLRIIFFLGWAVGGFLLARAAVSSGQPITPSLPLFVGALVIWVASVVDAQATVRTGSDTILVPRVFMWLVIGVVGLLMVTFVAASLSVGGTSAS